MTAVVCADEVQGRPDHKVRVLVLQQQSGPAILQLELADCNGDAFQVSETESTTNR